MDNQRAERLRTLLTHPAWQDLKDGLEADEKKWQEIVAKRLLKGKPGTQLEQGDLDFNRGFYAGVRSILGVPAEAEKQIVKQREEESSK